MDITLTRSYNMKYLLLLFLTFLTPLSALAGDAEFFEVEVSRNGNIRINFAVFDQKVIDGFDKYTCHVYLGNGQSYWKHSISASGVVAASTQSSCLDQGNMTPGRSYMLVIEFDDWPSHEKTMTLPMIIDIPYSGETTTATKVLYKP